MPKVRRSRKPPPDGWELIEPTLEELEQKMREGRFEKLFVSQRVTWLLSYYCDIVHHYIPCKPIKILLCLMKLFLIVIKLMNKVH